MKPVDEEVVKFYDAQKLDDSFVESLIVQANNQPKASSFRGWSIAALLVISTIVSSFFMHREYRVSAVMNEIAKNYIKNEKVLFHTSKYSVLQEKLSQLDFNIKPNQIRLLDGFDLVGGKYCSLEGSKAAQMKFVNPQTGESKILYAVSLSQTLDWIEQDEGEKMEVDINLWSESGTLFGLSSK